MSFKTAFTQAARREAFLEWGIAFFCMVAGLTGLRIVNDADLWKKFSLGSEAGVKAGVFRRLEGGVRLKTRESPLWHDLDQQALDVFGGDTVFTAGDGKGEISFSDGSTAQVLPDSLVVIRPPDEAEPSAGDWLSNLGRSVVGAAPPPATRIEVVQGGVKVHVRKRAKPPVLFAENRSFPVTASADGVTNSRGETDLELRVGSSAGKRTVTMTSSSGATVGGESLQAGAERVVTSPVAPLPATLAPAAPVVEAPPFIPAATAPAAPVAELPVAVPTVGAVPKVVAAPGIAATAPSPIAAPLTTPVDEPVAAATPVPKPKFVALPTLEASSIAGSTLAVDYDKLDRLSVLLRWKPIPGADRYDVKVTDDHQRDAGGKEVTKPSIEFVLRSLRTMNYFYRVRAHLETGETIVSPLIPIRIELSPPLLKSPEDGHTYAAGEDPLLTWAKTVLTKGYQIQIARDRWFAQPVLDALKVNNFTGFAEATPGEYYWRVRTSSDGHQSGWSKTRTFVVPGVAGAATR